MNGIMYLFISIVENKIIIELWNWIKCSKQVQRKIEYNHFMANEELTDKTMVGVMTRNWA